MSGINTKYTVTLKVLTPLFIGQGIEKDWVKGIDYIDQDNTLYHLDLSKMSEEEGIDMNQLSLLFIKQDTEGVRKLIGDKLAAVSDFQLSLPCTSSNPIRTFFRNQYTQCPTIPGSSLKGAIRSILFANMRGSEETRNEAVFGKLKNGGDFMRFIRVGDFAFPETGSTHLTNTKIYNLHRDKNDQTWLGGWKHEKNSTNKEFKDKGFNTICECISNDSTAIGSILLSPTLFNALLKYNTELEQKYKDGKVDQKYYERNRIDIPHKDAKKRLLEEDIKDLCDIINRHTMNYLTKELAFFEKFIDGTHADTIKEAIDTLLHMFASLQPNECILKLGAGSGFHSITGDWQFDDFVSGGELRRDKDHQNNLPKSRKIAITQKGEKCSFELMGFIKLTFAKKE
jgi:CRISPR/Cas system CSM-associated protein Csm5 (group 7 of RAMP superfamily)